MAVWSILSVHSNYTFRNWEDSWTQGIRYGQSLGQDSGSHQPLSPTRDHDDPSDSYVSMSSQSLYCIMLERPAYARPPGYSCPGKEAQVPLQKDGGVVAMYACSG